MKYLIATLVFLLVEVLYFAIAKRFDIVDRPNERSSHTRVTLLGGGVIFFLSLFYFCATNGWQYPWLLAGVALIAIVSYIDDMRGLPASLRFGVQLVTLFLVLFQFEAFSLDVWKVLLVVFVTMATVNIYNFMDGINGMLAAYSLVVLGTLAYANSINPFVNADLILFVMLSAAVFCFFNFRKKARCFSGDVGSIVMGCIVLFLMGRMIQASPSATQPLSCLIFIGVFLADGGLTILKRMLRGENIFQPHREHMYETLCNDLKVPHLWVSGSYAVVQLAINVCYFFVADKVLYAVAVAIVLFLLYSGFFFGFKQGYLKAKEK